MASFSKYHRCKGPHVHVRRIDNNVYCNTLHRGFLGSSLVESDNRKRRAGAGTAFSIMEPQYAEMDRQAADKKARR